MILPIILVISFGVGSIIILERIKKQEERKDNQITAIKIRLLREKYKKYNF